MGAVLLQKNILPLHGSAIIIEGKSYAIVGDSGAGKSTLAAAFINRGFQLLSDDVIPVRMTAENVPIVTPAYPQQKLWEESMIHFGLDANEFQPLVARDTKYAIPIHHHFSNKPFPLGGVFELEAAADQYEITIQPIIHLERFYKLFKHTYRNFFIQRAGLMDWHFSTSAKMINQIKMFQVKRPNSHFTADELAELILFRLKKETI
jgi:ABC-type dipeptide/oligopeptide/nickel transport system ATPase component